MIIRIKPLSINKAWQGKRYKTKAYKNYEKALLMILPKRLDCDLLGKLEINLTFGFSTKSADIDNPIKPILDILQKKYRFNDKNIYVLNVKKLDTKKGNEFIDIEIRSVK